MVIKKLEDRIELELLKKGDSAFALVSTINGGHTFYGAYELILEENGSDVLVLNDVLHLPFLINVKSVDEKQFKEFYKKFELKDYNKISIDSLIEDGQIYLVR